MERSEMRGGLSRISLALIRATVRNQTSRSSALCAARSVRPYLIQSYPRDMGNGVMVLMKEIDVPIRVLGRHWGGFRMAYKM
jgi:methyl-accepting chemotaxis protein